MRKLLQPTIGVLDVFDRCVAINAHGEVSQRCLRARSDVEASERTYATRAAIPEFTRFRSTRSSWNGATKDDLAELYTRLRDNKRTRALYDDIKANAAPGKCPYCGSGQVGTLDHYLPKMKYPLFAITPLNLIPCCERCNSTKGEAPPSSAGEQFFHPYFDQFDDERWLFAQLNETMPVSANYGVTPPLVWNATKRDRVHFHFDYLDLATVFITNAAEELQGVSAELRDIFEDGSEDELRSHLRRRAASHAAANLNSWQTALYYACSESEWFCSGGFIPA